MSNDVAYVKSSGLGDVNRQDAKKGVGSREWRMGRENFLSPFPLLAVDSGQDQTQVAKFMHEVILSLEMPADLRQDVFRKEGQ